jgi:chemotaxis protein MotB
MSRRKKQAAPENHERWLVSYADFITLLFAFFVVMFASSQTDKAKAKQVSEAITEALEHGKFGGAVAGLLGRTMNAKPKPNDKPAPPALPAAKSAGDLAASLEILSRELQKEIDAGKVKVTLEARGLVISLREAAYFPSGDDGILAPGDLSLERIAAAIRSLPNGVRLEGHTDSVPIHTARFESNWQLSAARGIAMLDLFTRRYALPPQRFSIAGFADTVPVESNESEGGRSHNRRVDIVILNPEGLHIESQPRATSPPGQGGKSG